MVPPKSTGREYFSEIFLKKFELGNMTKESIIATLTE
jgi:1,6-anhydro-N-acetylmuramate kinase